jgi:hypothetical protein
MNDASRHPHTDVPFVTIGNDRITAKYTLVLRSARHGRDRPAISYALLLPRDWKRNRGEVSTIVDLGSASLFDPLFKTPLTTYHNRKKG